MKKIISLLTFLIFSCGIENPESAVEFGAPLGLQSWLSNSSIYISFYGFNNETYFEGYNVYISDNPADLVSFDKLGRKVLKDENSSNKPSIEMTPFSDAPRQFFFEIRTTYYYTLINSQSVLNENLSPGTTYYITVRSYGNNVLSKKYANIVSITY